MAQYIDKSAVLAEIERKRDAALTRQHNLEAIGQVTVLNETLARELSRIISFIDTLEVKDPYEQCIQYPSVKDGIEAHAETYSFNIESELFNQLTKEQQALWRKEIEQACISGGNAGVELARDPRYKENLEVKEVDYERELSKYVSNGIHRFFPNVDDDYCKMDSVTWQDYVIETAKHFFELGLSVNNPVTAADRGTAEEIILALNTLGEEKMISYSKEIEWLNKLKE